MPIWLDQPGWSGWMAPRPRGLLASTHGSRMLSYLRPSDRPIIPSMYEQPWLASPFRVLPYVHLIH